MSVERAVLITNLHLVAIGAVRAKCHALLLHEDPESVSGGPARCIRAFGCEPSWEVFSIETKTIDFEITHDASGATLIGGVEYGVKITLTVDGAPDMILYRDDALKPLEVERFEGGDGRVLPGKVWPVLTERVARFWRAPYMLGVDSVPPRELVAANHARWRVE